MPAYAPHFHAATSTDPGPYQSDQTFPKLADALEDLRQRFHLTDDQIARLKRYGQLLAVTGGHTQYLYAFGCSCPAGNYGTSKPETTIFGGPY